MNVPKLLKPNTGIKEKTEQLKEGAKILPKSEPQNLKEILEELADDLSQYCKYKLIVGRAEGRSPATSSYSYIEEEKEHPSKRYLRAFTFLEPFLKKQRRTVIMVHEEPIPVIKDHTILYAYLREDVYIKDVKATELVRKHIEPYSKMKGAKDVHITKVDLKSFAFRKVK